MKSRINFKLIVIASCVIILITIFSTLAIGLKADEGARGTFGDMFGFANALFTGLSFLGLIITILLQRQDINDQRQDTKIQNFEATFFNLLNFHRETINSLEKHYQWRRTSGAKVETKDYTSRGSQLMRKIFEQYLEGLKGDKKFNKELYKNLYKLNWDVLGHYYRGVQGMFDFIESLHLHKYDDFYYKRRYFDILKSQLSEYETVMIFYHFLFIQNDKYKILAVKYNFFEFVNEELVTDDVELYKF